MPPNRAEHGQQILEPPSLVFVTSHHDAVGRVRLQLRRDRHYVEFEAVLIEDPDLRHHADADATRHEALERVERTDFEADVRREIQTSESLLEDAAAELNLQDDQRKPPHDL